MLNCRNASRPASSFNQHSEISIRKSAFGNQHSEISTQSFQREFYFAGIQHSAFDIQHFQRQSISVAGQP
jgi:hypothetical protein